jgi:hypothetical protein
VDSGGLPGDDNGLPPVDVRVPDDARELDRDVHAYHRELRAQRRRRRWQRLAAPFVKHGMIVPLLAGAMALSLLAGTLLTVASSGQGNRAVPLQPQRSLAPQPTESVGQAGGLLPDATVLVAGKQTRLRDLTTSVLTLVPDGCSCVPALQQLTQQAVATQVKIYFVGTGGAVRPLTGLAARVGTAANRTIQVVDDSGSVLASTYHPAGLTAVLVHSDGAAGPVQRNLLQGMRLEASLAKLGTPGWGYPSG